MAGAEDSPGDSMPRASKYPGTGLADAEVVLPLRQMGPQPAKLVITSRRGRPGTLLRAMSWA